MRRAVPAVLAALALAGAGCGNDDPQPGIGDDEPAAGQREPTRTVERITRVEAVEQSGAGG